MLTVGDHVRDVHLKAVRPGPGGLPPVSASTEIGPETDAGKRKTMVF